MASSVLAGPSAVATLPRQLATSPALSMPRVGVGTYKMSQPRATVRSALRLGYRCIDTAFIYGGEKTEPEVGGAICDAIADGDVLREELFVITKQWRKYHGEEPTASLIDRSLDRLGLSYIDLYLIHWPGPAWRTMSRRRDKMEQHGPWVYAAEGHTEESMAELRAGTWRAMEAALRSGKVRAIGVSNFAVPHLEALKATASIWPPAVNQVELHPLYPQHELRAYCAKEGILLQAYASLGGQDASRATWKQLGGRLLEALPVTQAAMAHGRTPAQVLLRWALQKGAVVVPKANSEARLAENLSLDGFELTCDEVEAIDALDKGDAGRLCWRTDPLRMLQFA